MTAFPATEADLVFVRQWTAEHGLTLRGVPEHGWIVHGLAYMCAVQVGDTAWLELALTNPKAPRSMRYAGLGACLHAAEEWARSVGIKKLFAFTDRPVIARWGAGKGYAPEKGALISKELSDASR